MEEKLSTLVRCKYTFEKETIASKLILYLIAFCCYLIFLFYCFTVNFHGFNALAFFLLFSIIGCFIRNESIYFV